MSMPDFYPDPEVPMDPEMSGLDEVLLEAEASGLPRDLQDILADSIDMDDAQRKIASRRPDIAENRETLMWVRRAPIDDEHAPTPYTQLEWRPDYASLAERRDLQRQGKRPLADTVSNIFVRTPTVTQELLSFYGAEEGQRVKLNDRFIQVVRPDGSSIYYLYNSQGIVAYDNNDSLQELVHEAATLKPNDVDEYGEFIGLDMFTVVRPHTDPTVMHLTPAKLRAMLKDSRQRQQAPKDLEE